MWTKNPGEDKIIWGFAIEDDGSGMKRKNLSHENRIFATKLEHYENNLLQHTCFGRTKKKQTSNLLVMLSDSTNWWNHFKKHSSYVKLSLKKEGKKKTRAAKSSQILKALSCLISLWGAVFFFSGECGTAKIIASKADAVCMCIQIQLHNCCNDDRSVGWLVCERENFRHPMRQPI